MKKTILLTGCLVVATGLFAQKSKIVSAHNYLRYEEFDKAKVAIDEAAVHTESAGMAKTWLYRGHIYRGIAKSAKPEVQALAPDAMQEAYKSYMKAYEFDTKKIDIDELNQSLAGTVPDLFGKGVEKFNAKDFSGATALFENCIEVGKKFGRTDTLSMYNAGLASERGENYEKALQYYSKCKDMNYSGSKMYGIIAELYKKMGKDADAMALIKEGRTKYPNDQDLVTTEINYFLKNENYQQALGNLDIAIQNDPKNPTFFFARGSIQDQQQQFDKAEADYLKAIELKPDFFDAIYNLGALHFNRGADLYNKANDVPLKEVQKATDLRNEAEALFKKALPYLERARELQPNDKSTLISLKNIYVRTGQTEKYNEVTEKLKNL